MNWVPLELSLRQFFHIKSLTTLNNLVIFLQHIIIHPQGILRGDPPAFSLNLLHGSCILSFLPPKYYAGIKLALLRFLCIRRNPLIANNLLNIIGMYYLLIITNCICHKYGARLRQIACFWVILKKNSCAGGRYSAPSRPHMPISCIFSNLTRQVCPKRKKLIQDWVSSTHRWRSTLSLCSNSD